MSTSKGKKPSQNQKKQGAKASSQNPTRRVNTSSPKKDDDSLSRKKSKSSQMKTRIRQLEAKKKRKKRVKRAILIVITTLVAIAIILVLGVYFGGKYLIGRVQTQVDTSDASMIDEFGSKVLIDSVASDKSDQFLSEEGIRNILLIGIDSRNEDYAENGEGSLADIIMILTIDEKEKVLKLSSIQRDAYAYVPGHSEPMKINAAMSYGGATLLLRTVEEHLRIDLENYAYVDISHMERIIDMVGGVVVPLTDEERSAEGGLNSLIREQNVLFGSPSEYNFVYETGDVWLNGRQAVAYARIRHIGNGNYTRSQRQIIVLESMLKNYMNVSLPDKIGIISDILSEVVTNLQGEEIEQYVMQFLPSIMSLQIENMQIPPEGYYHSDTYYDVIKRGEWSIRPNWNAVIPVVQEYIFGVTEEFEPVLEIPKEPTVSEIEENKE